MRGTVPCLSADLTTHAVPLQALQDLKMGGSAGVSILAQERREVREREGFHRRALPVCGSDNPRRATSNPAGFENWREREGFHRGAGAP